MVAGNGLGLKVVVVGKDARRLAVVPAPDGTPPDMERPADILVYEVRFLPGAGVDLFQPPGLSFRMQI